MPTEILLPNVFASTPKPPYYVVAFSSQRNGTDAAQYTQAAQRMMELAVQQEGYLGAESARGADGFGITLSYWRDEVAILAWKIHSEHTLTRELGRARWYEAFFTRVAKVERAYGWSAPQRLAQDNGN